MNQDKEEIKVLLFRSFIQLCKDKLTCRYWFTIKGSLEVNIDDREVFLVDICEKVFPNSALDASEVKKTASRNISNTSMTAVLQSTASEFLGQRIKQEGEDIDTGILEAHNSLIENMHEAKASVSLKALQTGPIETARLASVQPVVWSEQDISSDTKDTGQAGENDILSADVCTAVREANNKKYSEVENKEEAGKVNKLVPCIQKKDVSSMEYIVEGVPEPDWNSVATNKVNYLSYDGESDKEESDNKEDESEPGDSKIAVKLETSLTCESTDTVSDRNHSNTRNISPTVRRNKWLQREQTSKKVKDNTISEEMKLYKCPFCGKKFVQLKRYKNHIVSAHDDTENNKNLKDCSGKNKYKCTACGKQFLQVKRYAQHLQLPHAENILADIESHSVTDTCIGEDGAHLKRYKCPTCGNKFLHLTTFIKHLKTPHGQRRFKCTICDKSFSDKSNMRAHVAIHSEEKPYHCSFCEKVFRYRGELRVHKRIHTGERPYVCKICSKSFTRSGTLKTHMLTHTERKKSLICNFCGKAFCHIGSYKRHLTSHTDEKPAFVCNICGKVLTQLGSLKTHQLIHSGEKQHICNICGRSFTQLGNLKAHQRTHTGEKPYMCSMCDHAFAQLSSLNSHMTIHTGQKKFTCKTCGKGFVDSFRMKIHNRIHTGEKPHICTICGKGFAEPGNLKIHMRIHTGEKPYACTYCGKAFSQHSSMKIHERMHTGEKPYMCDICGTGFSQMASLKSHKLAHNSDSI